MLNIIYSGYYAKSIRAIFIGGWVLLSGCVPEPIVITTTPDAFDSPATVELPGGKFYMGDQNGIGDSDERPVQQIQISAFAISKYEITFKEFDQFTDATGRVRVDDNDWGRNKLPVINVSWDDAQAYTQWLTQKSGKTWRLPTEAEWEYAARADGLSNYQSGNQPESVCSVGNIADEKAFEAGIVQQITRCNDGAVHTNIVGSYRASAFGLYDMHGNTWEWLADCYHIYGSTPSAGSCEKRVIRGGSFLTPATSARLSNREAIKPTEQLIQVGFRVVRDL